MLIRYIIFLYAFLGSASAKIMTAQMVNKTHLTVYFGTDRFALDSIAIQGLSEFALRTDRVETITGYADTVGARSYNLDLSRKRSEAVYDFLRARNIKVVNAPEYKGELMIPDSPLRECRVVKIEGWSERRTDPVVKPKITTAIEIPLTNVFFLPDKPILAPESVPNVEKIARYLKGFSCRILIIGHVNYQGSEVLGKSDDMFKLSEQRAKAIFDLLADFGIDKQEMDFKGVGNSEPLIANPKTDDEKRANMRVQLFMLPK